MANAIIDTFDFWTTAQALKTSNRGRGASNQSLLGIKKLRELILELAVSGKLIPQDPTEEPAGELLKKIELEKKRLVKDGKIKKQDVLPNVIKIEMPFDLPGTWIWTRLGVLSIINPRNEIGDDTLASFVPMTLITTSHTGKHGQNESRWGDIKNGFTHFANGDIGLAKITPCFENSKAVVFSDLINGIGAGTTELHIARTFGDTLYNRYVLLYLKAPQFLLLGEAKMTGTAGQKRVPRSFFAENPFPLPPLAEQHRIVSKVDELMALCDQLEQQQTNSNSAHQTLVDTLLGTLTNAESPAAFDEAWQRFANHFDALLTTEHSIDQLKQTILQLAVMGKLVPQNLDDEPASELLKKIAKEKARLIKEGKIKKQDSLLTISQDEKMFELPIGWVWVRLNDAIDVRDGTHDTPKEAFGENTYPLVTSKNFENGDIKFDEAKRVSAEDHFEISKRSYVSRFDILFSMIGGNLGNQVMVNDDRPFSIKNVALFKYYNKEYTNPFFIKKIMEHIAIDLQNKSIGGAQPFVSLGFLRNIAIALPPNAEQHRIVTKVDELFALCDALKERLRDVQALQGQLAFAVVEQAVN